MKEHDVPKELRSRKRDGHNPIKELTRTLGEFKRGLSHLDSVASSLAKPSRASQPIRELRSTVSKETVRDRMVQGPKELVREKAITPGVLTRSTFRDSSAARLPATYPAMHRSPHSAMRYKIKDTAFGPEDHEAITHLREVLNPLSYEGLPRAVRAALAQEMKSKNPERDVKAALPGSGGSRAGGSSAPSTHWRPEIARMVERYQTELGLATSKLERAERTVYGAAAGPSHSSHSSHVSSHTSSMMPQLREGASAAQLLEHNDISHTSGHGEHMARETMRNRKIPDSPAASPKANKEHKLQPISGSRHAGGGSSSPSKPAGSAIPAQRKLTGTLTLMGSNGTVAGTAKLDATEG